MKTLAKPVAENITVGAKIGLDFSLVDKRIMSYGIVFGTAGQVAKQYGVKAFFNGKISIFSAPKTRMQMFVEKLHFSKIAFFEI